MNPLIVLGAGASYDCIDLNKYFSGPLRKDELRLYRPPLLNDIFNPNRFEFWLRKYPYAAELASHAQGVENIEDYFTSVQDLHAKNNPERYKQLIGLRFYLSELFSKITEKYSQPINYFSKMITGIKDYGGSAWIVNFNYDLLFESNLSNILYASNTDSYIDQSIKVIKIHGACNWFYQLNSFAGENKYTGAVEMFNKYASNIHEFSSSDRKDKELVIKNSITDPQWNYKEVIGSKRNYYLPAIAVPLKTKAKYICPDLHINMFEQALPKLDRILIIGWKAEDEYLVDLLINNVVEKVKVTIVSLSSSENVREKLEANKNLLIESLPITFSDFIAKGGFDSFLSN